MKHHEQDPGNRASTRPARGKPKALVALGHTLFVIVYYLLYSGPKSQVQKSVAGKIPFLSFNDELRWEEMRE